MSTPAPANIKKRGRGVFCTPKTSPLIQKQDPRISRVCSPRVTIFRVFDSVLRYYSSPTSKYLILGLSSFPLMYFGALSCMYLLKNVRDLSLNCCLFLLNWGVVRDGLRPRVHSEVMGHATLPPFSWYSCLNMRPPSARWNASTTYEHGFVSFGLWNCFICIGTAWRI